MLSMPVLSPAFIHIIVFQISSLMISEVFMSSVVSGLDGISVEVSGAGLISTSSKCFLPSFSDFFFCQPFSFLVILLCPTFLVAGCIISFLHHMHFSLDLAMLARLCCLPSFPLSFHKFFLTSLSFIRQSPFQFQLFFNLSDHDVSCFIFHCFLSSIFSSFLG